MILRVRTDSRTVYKDFWRGYTRTAAERHSDFYILNTFLGSFRYRHPTHRFLTRRGWLMQALSLVIIASAGDPHNNNQVHYKPRYTRGPLFFPNQTHNKFGPRCVFHPLRPCHPGGKACFLQLVQGMLTPCWMHVFPKTLMSAKYK